MLHDTCMFESKPDIQGRAEIERFVIAGKINGTPDPRFGAANPTPEQRERYARYKDSTA